MKQGEADSFSFIEPMQALPVRELLSGDWVYEMKFDGHGAPAFKAGKETRLVSPKVIGVSLSKRDQRLRCRGRSAKMTGHRSLKTGSPCRAGGRT